MPQEMISRPLHFCSWGLYPTGTLSVGTDTDVHPHSAGHSLRAPIWVLHSKMLHTGTCKLLVLSPRRN